MPDIDGGHCFLTAFAPVRIAERTRPDGSVTSCVQLLREELALIPTAAQSPVSVEGGMQSPFAGSRRTHFLRLFIIDQPMWNGRVGMDPLIARLRRVDPLVHQPVDMLRSPWLVLSAEFDRNDHPDHGFDSWAEEIWASAAAELKAVFAHCHGFEASDGPGFAAYLRRCRIETTMSFNDYWPGRPPLKGWTLTGLGLRGLAAGIAIAALAALILHIAGLSLWWLAAALPVALALGLVLAIARAAHMGRKPLPPAPDSDLPAILKALHVQQRFAFLAESAQGLSEDGLHAAFAAFLADVRPGDLAHPTQPPGVIRSDGVQLSARPIADFRAAAL